MKVFLALPSQRWLKCKPYHPIRWKQTLSAAIPSDCERMRWSLDENAPVLWRKSWQAVLLQNEPPFERTLKWLSVFGLCTRREPFAFATSPAAQPAAEEVHRWKATVLCVLVPSPSFSLLERLPSSSAAYVPPCVRRGTVTQRYQQIAKSQRQTAGKCAKRDSLPARYTSHKLESDQLVCFMPAFHIFLSFSRSLDKIKELNFKSLLQHCRHARNTCEM